MGVLWWVLVAIPLGVGALWYKQHVLDRAPPAPEVLDAFGVELGFWPDGADAPIPLSAVKKGMRGALTVAAQRDGTALLLTMNSAGGMFPITEPTDVKANTPTRMPVLSEGKPYALRIEAAEHARQLVGGGPYYAVVAASRASIESMTVWAKTYRSYWSPRGLPNATRVFLADPPTVDAPGIDAFTGERVP